MPSLSAVSSNVATVHRTTFSSGQVALYTMAAGVSPGYPPFTSSSDSSPVMPALRNITMVLPWAANFSMDSRSGTGVLPAILVITTLWLIPGRVYSIPRAAAAPQKELTPGHMSYFIPLASSPSICSRMAP